MHANGAVGLLKLFGLLELCHHRDWIDRLPLRVQRENRLPEDVVARPVEVAWLQTSLLHLPQRRAAGFGPQRAGTEKGPKDLLLGVEVLRGQFAHRLDGPRLHAAALTSGFPLTHPRSEAASAALRRT